MNEIAISQPVVEYQKNALVFLDKPSWEQAESLVNTLLTMNGSVQFWLGDAMNHLAGWYPEYEQLFPDGYSAKSLANIKWVASKIEPTRRRELSWSHHEAASGLDNPEDQDEVLETAELNDMTVSETRKMVRAMKGKPDPVKEPKVIHCVCPECQCEFEEVVE